MENPRDREGRSSQPDSNPAGERDKTKAHLDFEEMNFEQKREPYQDRLTKYSERINNGNNDYNEDNR